MRAGRLDQGVLGVILLTPFWVCPGLLWSAFNIRFSILAFCCFKNSLFISHVCIFFFKKIFVYLSLAASCFTCSRQALCGCVWASLQLWLAGSRARGLSSCGARAKLPRGMWDLSFPTRDQTGIPCIARPILNHWTTREVPTCMYFPLWKINSAEVSFSYNKVHPF